MTSNSNFEDFFMSPVSDEDYIRRIKQLRESFKFQKLKYGKVSEKIAAANFKIMFSESELCFNSRAKEASA